MDHLRSPMPARIKERPLRLSKSEMDGGVKRVVYEGMIAESLTIYGQDGDPIEAYSARPLGPGPFPGVVVIHHAPGWDDWCKEVARKFAHHGYSAIDPNLHHRAGPGSPDDVAARVRAAGGLADEQVVGDIDGAMKHLRMQPNANGKVGLIGFCSGGRQAYVAACRLSGVDATVDCWGGSVIIDDPSQLNALRPTAPIDLTQHMTSPLLGLFGNEDSNPNPDQVDRTEQVLQVLGKTYAFHRYEGAGHAFFVPSRAAYRPEQAVDGWQRVFAFYAEHLNGEPAAA
jgi:carboxymethylenebutenolidase